MRGFLPGAIPVSIVHDAAREAAAGSLPHVATRPMGLRGWVARQLIRAMGAGEEGP